MSNFKVGDVVELNSGGQEMTIIEVTGEQCVCQWFDDKKNQFQNGKFHSAVLKEPPDPMEVALAASKFM